METEFGAKVAISMADGYAFIDHLSWDSFNESLGLKKAVEDYKQRFGLYPEAVLADQLYRTRENLSFCRKHGIRRKLRRRWVVRHSIADKRRKSRART